MFLNSLLVVQNLKMDNHVSFTNIFALAEQIRTCGLLVDCMVPASSWNIDLKKHPNRKKLFFVCRVCKYQRQKKLKDDDNNENEFMYRQHICGIITTTYKFKSLCDYQYLPLKRDAESGKMQSMILHLKVDESTLQDKSFFTRDVPLFLPPPIFGRIDKPYSYQYKKEHYSYKQVSNSCKFDIISDKINCL